MFIVITHVAIGDGTSVSYLMMVPHSGNGSLQGNRGLRRVAGAFEAGNHRQTLDRCRPIVLTTVTTVLGLLPLYLGGGEMWDPMVLAIMGGCWCPLG